MKKVWIVLLTLLMCSCKPQLQLKEKYKNVSWSYSPNEDIVYVVMVEKEEIKKEWKLYWRTYEKRDKRVLLL